MSKPIRTAVLHCYLIAAVTQAGPIQLAVDPASSNADVELCMTVATTVCDTDSSPVTGSMTVALDCPVGPGEITLHGFLFQLTDAVDLHLNFGILGGLVATGNELAVYDDAIDPLPPSLLVGRAFAIPDVPVRAAGHLEYAATGGVCTLLTLNGFSCDDIIDLSSIGFEPVTLQGSVTTDGSDVSVTVQSALQAPIEPLNPELGHININATMVAVGEVPPPCCPGDLTGDDRVDAQDHPRFAGCLLGPSGSAAGPCVCADLDGDGDIDLADFAAFQLAFSG